MLSGLSGSVQTPDPGVRLRYEGHRQWGTDIEHLTFRQVNNQNVPIYGSNIVFTYTLNRLTLISNSLYPATASVIDNLFPEGVEGTWENTLNREAMMRLRRGNLNSQGSAFQIAADRLRLVGLPNEVERQLVALEAPYNLREESVERGWLADRFILPYLHLPDASDDTEAKGPILRGLKGEYLPVWRVVLVDTRGFRWLTVYDARSYEVLMLALTRVGASQNALVYLSPADASTSTQTPVSLEFGSGTDLTTADHVHMTGTR